MDLDGRVVVSTGTKNLQEQLVTKDIPLLERALGRPLRVALMKGRANYLCRLRFRSFSASPGTFGRWPRSPCSDRSSDGRSGRCSGDRAEIDGLPDSVGFWRDISAASENCIGQSCPLFEDCYITRMRQRAARGGPRGRQPPPALRRHRREGVELRRRSIPEYDTAVLDEAHMLEDVATQYFGLHMSSFRADDLARDVERELSAAGMDARDVRPEAEGLPREGGAAVRS